MSDRPPDDARSLVGRLYDTYGASLYRYAALLLADATAAEDVVQQVFTSILRKGPRLTRTLRRPMCPAIFIAWRVCAYPASRPTQGRERAGNSRVKGSSSACPLMGA